MGFSFGNAIASVEDPHIRACLQQLAREANSAPGATSVAIQGAISAIPSGIAGSGTTSQLPIWTAPNALGSSNISDDLSGLSVAIISGSMYASALFGVTAESGGSFIFRCGDGGVTSGGGGSFSQQAGSALGPGAGGFFRQFAGDSNDTDGAWFSAFCGNVIAGNGNGGNYFAQLGRGSGTGHNGIFQIASGAGYDCNFNVDSLTNDRTFTWPDGTGTIPLPTLTQTWSSVQTYSAQDVHSAGVSLLGSGVLAGASTASASTVAYDFHPGTSTAVSTVNDRHIFHFWDSAGNWPLALSSDGMLILNGSAAYGTGPNALIYAAGSLPTTTVSGGVNFGFSGISSAGVTIAGKGTTVFGGAFAGRSSSDSTAVRVFGGIFYNNSFNQAIAHTQFYAGKFKMTSSTTTSGTLTTTEAGGILIEQATGAALGTGVVTAWNGIKIENGRSSAKPTITTQYGINIDEQTIGGANYGIFLANATAGYKAIAIRDTNTWIGSTAAATMDLNATTINFAVTNMGFFGVTAAARPGAFTQTYATASHTHPNLTATTVATTAATNVAPYGYTQAQADAIPVAINALLSDLTDLKKVVNALIDDGQSIGLLQ